MRASELTRSGIDLFEISMSPTNLEQLARQVQGVRVGMEFEMYVPDAGERKQEIKPEREREDEVADSISNIEDFFQWR